MSEKIKTFACVILDRSGSMVSCREATLRGVNEKLQQLREESKNQEILVSFFSFNGGVYEHAFNQPAESLADLTETDYYPNGSTAMLDAVGYAVSKLKAETANETGNIAYLVEIVSDGEENASREFSREAVAKLIKDCTKTGKWTFTYMGSNQDLSKVAKSMNIPVGNVAVYDSLKEDAAFAGMRWANVASADYLRGRSAGMRGMSASVYNSNSSVSNFVSDSASMPDWTVSKSVPTGGTTLTAQLVDNLTKYSDQT